MPRYRKKPIVIEAERVSLLHQWAGHDWMMLPKWVADAYDCGKLLFLNHPARLSIKTLEGAMTADHSDMLIRGVEGELYPCKPEIFAKTYELEVDNAKE